MNDAVKKTDNVVNLECGTWSPQQVIRELQQMNDRGEIEALTVAVEMTDEHYDKHGYAMDWLGSHSTNNQRVYMVTWLYQRTVGRLFG